MEIIHTRSTLHNVPGGIVGVGLASVGVSVFVSVSVYFRDKVIEQ